MINRRILYLSLATIPLILLVGFGSTVAGLDWAGYGLDGEPPSQLSPEITLIKTVGSDPEFCGQSNSIDVPAGTQVTYCFDVTNSGTVTLTQHELVDSELGLLLDDTYPLVPGASRTITATAAIETTTVNTATWTAFNLGPTDVVTSSDWATVTVVPAALIEVIPSSLSSIQGPDVQISLPLDIGNIGDLDLEWELFEEETAAEERSGDISPTKRDESIWADSQEIVKSADECSKYVNYAGAEPIGYAEICLGITPPRIPQRSGALFGPTDIAYAQDIGFVSDNFVRHQLDNFPWQTIVGQQAAAIFGYDFDVTAEVLYALNDDTKQLGIIDLNTGSFNPLGQTLPISETLTGLTIHPLTGDAYVSTADDLLGSQLYSIDLSSGLMSFIANITNADIVIDIAINRDGVMYGHDITSDSIYTIDTATGWATLVGLTGIDANFAQGMDFDNSDGKLYAWIYQGGGANQYGIINLDTGALDPLAISNPEGEFEGATKTGGCARFNEVSWLSAGPTSGVVSPGFSQTISITINSSNLSSGTYYSAVCIQSNDFFGTVVRIPVSLEVESVAAIRLVKTVGLDPNECAADDHISIPSSTRVYYCYKFTNTGSTPFSRHNLVDSELPYPILDDYLALLLPGDSLEPIVDVIIFKTTVNTATWTAFNPGPIDQVSDTDSATVIVSSRVVFAPYILRP
jgi:hypothetical protein